MVARLRARRVALALALAACGGAALARGAAAAKPKAAAPEVAPEAPPAASPPADSACPWVPPVPGVDQSPSDPGEYGRCTPKVEVNDTNWCRFNQLGQCARGAARGGAAAPAARQTRGRFGRRAPVRAPGCRAAARAGPSGPSKKAERCLKNGRMTVYRGCARARARAAVRAPHGALGACGRVGWPAVRAPAGADARAPAPAHRPGP